ncbi:MAG: cupin domain-containing protein [Burkholderiales bacterium]|nr:cupin domain-containing protein [Burkholderiales bacterium]
MNRLVSLLSAACVIVAAFALPGRVCADGGLRVLMKDADTAAADLQWSEPKAIPAGTRMIMVYGSPAEAGPYIFRVWFPAGYKLPPHRHTDKRQVTVLEGSYWSGAGETFVQERLKRFGPRDHYITEADVPHFAWAETDVLIQEAGIGPIATPIQYVRSEDDPRR